MDPALGTIDPGDLLIDNGKIVAVGRNVGSWAVMEIDGRGMIAMPGFINGHIHLWQTALRGVEHAQQTGDDGKADAGTRHHQVSSMPRA
jgi:cytosine/adenosine deaminase-related metal-dependent hydrolase